MIRFIDEYRNRFSVEFICKTLKKNRAGGFITSRGYRQSKARGVSARGLRDAVLVERISAIHRDNYGIYGVRKMWHALHRDGIDIGREQTARLMRLAGVSGKGKGRSPMTTRTPQRPDLRPDLVEREFKAEGPNKLWVADITYVRTKKGFVYAAFVTDVYSRRIVGWALSDSMRTEALPLQALNQAIASQVLFRLMKPVFETTYGAQRTPMPKLPQHRLPHQTHDSGIHTLNPHACNLRTSKIEK
ncbi:IS3 family transposase [Corynebacterium sp. HMSC08C04]|uniref:IS3 family transposase n=1 Tax=Corynebacterium sp. HMSC08C04 TaxID=1581137 RepID=UPI000B17F664|nr:IS3 family transposase [Corynebacterium sp. HMSC08C04]